LQRVPPCLLRLLRWLSGRLPITAVLRHVESTTMAETGPMPAYEHRGGATRSRRQPERRSFRTKGSPAEPIWEPEPACGQRDATSLIGSASPDAAVPAGSGIPAQLPWASRSRAGRCPSGGRSEICLPCGWQHSPSSEACSCQVRPSQHQPWLVSTCSVTAHPSPQALQSVCVYPGARRRTHPALVLPPRTRYDVAYRGCGPPIGSEGERGQGAGGGKAAYYSIGRSGPTARPTALMLRYRASACSEASQQLVPKPAKHSAA
jgi:hypothetical protein